MVQLSLMDAGAGATATGAAATSTSTGMATVTPVPVTVIVPKYAPTRVNDVVAKVTDKLAGFDWLTLKLLDESPIHDWLALAVRETAAAEVVLN